MSQTQTVGDQLLYDFVIIGGGTAGCVLAHRLSTQHPEFHILVLEAGYDRRKDERVYTPGLMAEPRGNGDFDWQFETTPQRGLNGHSMKHPRGKVLGGSSAINSLALIYPNAAGVDVWGDLGNRGWDWNTLAPYFRKFQTLCTPGTCFEGPNALPVVSAPLDSNLNNGPIQASLPATKNDLHDAWLDTFRHFQLENVNDPLDGEALGGYISTCHITDDSKERSHAGVAYLDDKTMELDNLHIVTNAMVDRLEFGRKTGSKRAKAEGVSYWKEGRRHLARVSKEVILAAGVFGSPQILERSGIGNNALLHKYGIDVVHANDNVGENLQDHLRVGLSFESDPRLDLGQPKDGEDARKLYEEHREGPWTRGCCTFGHLPLLFNVSDVERKEIQQRVRHSLGRPTGDKFLDRRNTYIRNMLVSETEGTATIFASRQPADNGLTPPIDSPVNYISIFAMLSHPLSAGWCHITSSAPDASPQIDPQYYSQPLDLDVHARLLLSIDRIMRSSSMSACRLPGGRTLPDGANLDTLEGAKAVCRKFARTKYHPCGTCSMMPEEIGGVVNEELRVYGTSNVRVVDASVFPIMPRGNIITMVYAVAERAADLVLEDWKVLVP